MAFPSYDQALIAARKAEGALTAQMGKRIEAAIREYTRGIEATVSSLPRGATRARRVALLKATERIQTIAARRLQENVTAAIAQQRTIAFNQVKEIWQEAAFAAADSIGVGRVGAIATPPVTLLGAFEGLGAKTDWRTLVKGHIGKVREEVNVIVRAAILNGSDGRALARGLRSYVDGSQSLRQAFKGQGIPFKDLKAAPGTRGAARRVDFNSRRIAFSEMHNARREAEVQHFAVDPLIQATKWELAPARGLANVPDECDMLATANFYGLGPGVYPVKSVPGSPHPFDRCELIPVTTNTPGLPKPEGEFTGGAVLRNLPIPNIAGKQRISRARAKLIRRHTDEAIQRGAPPDLRGLLDDLVESGRVSFQAPRPATIEKAIRALEMREQGFTFEQIGAALGTNDSGAFRLVKIAKDLQAGTTDIGKALAKLKKLKPAEAFGDDIVESVFKLFPERSAFDKALLKELRKFPPSAFINQAGVAIPDALVLKHVNTTVRLADLVTSQATLDTNSLRALIRGSGEVVPFDPPIVIRFRGRLVIEDGNHRLASDFLLGKTEARVNLVDLDDIIGKQILPPKPVTGLVTDDIAVNMTDDAFLNTFNATPVRPVQSNLSAVIKDAKDSSARWVRTVKHTKDKRLKELDKSIDTWVQGQEGLVHDEMAAALAGQEFRQEGAAWILRGMNTGPQFERLTRGLVFEDLGAARKAFTQGKRFSSEGRGWTISDDIAEDVLDFTINESFLGEVPVLLEVEGAQGMPFYRMHPRFNLFGEQLEVAVGGEFEILAVKESVINVAGESLQGLRITVRQVKNVRAPTSLVKKGDKFVAKFDDLPTPPAGGAVPDVPIPKLPEQFTTIDDAFLIRQAIEGGVTEAQVINQFKITNRQLRQLLDSVEQRIRDAQFEFLPPAGKRIGEKTLERLRITHLRRIEGRSFQQIGNELGLGAARIRELDKQAIKLLADGNVRFGAKVPGGGAMIPQGGAGLKGVKERVVLRKPNIDEQIELDLLTGFVTDENLALAQRILDLAAERNITKIADIAKELGVGAGRASRLKELARELKKANITEANIPVVGPSGFTELELKFLTPSELNLEQGRRASIVRRRKASIDGDIDKTLKTDIREIDFDLDPKLRFSDEVKLSTKEWANVGLQERGAVGEAYQDYARAVDRLAKPRIIKSTTDNGYSFYNPIMNQITMDKPYKTFGKSSDRASWVVRHEYGHHMDSEMATYFNFSGISDLASHPRFQNAFQAARTRIQNDPTFRAKVKKFLQVIDGGPNAGGRFAINAGEQVGMRTMGNDLIGSMTWDFPGRIPEVRTGLGTGKQLVNNPAKLGQGHGTAYYSGNPGFDANEVMANWWSFMTMPDAQAINSAGQDVRLMLRELFPEWDEAVRQALKGMINKRDF